MADMANWLTTDHGAVGMSVTKRRHWGLEGIVRRVALACAVLALVMACTDSGEPSSVWDDLSGTIYFIPSGFGPVMALNPVTGEVRSVPGAPAENLALAAPPSGEFLVVGGGRLFRLDMDDSELNWIVGERGLWPVVSPSGTLVAFSHSQPGGSAIRRVRSDGSDMVELLPAPGQLEAYPQTWLGDSTFLFLWTDSLGLQRIWSVRSDGTGMAPVGGDTGTVALGVAAPLSGNRLALHRVTPDLDHVELWEATTDGQYTRYLTTYSGHCASHLGWSPDEQYLMSCTVGESGTLDVILTHVATGTTRIIETPDIHELELAWTARPW